VAPRLGTAELLWVTTNGLCRHCRPFDRLIDEEQSNGIGDDPSAQVRRLQLRTPDSGALSKSTVTGIMVFDLVVEEGRGVEADEGLSGDQ